MLLLKSKVIGKEIGISTRFLHDYLAARRIILTRQDEHRRLSDQSTRPFLGGRKQEEFNKESYADA